MILDPGQETARKSEIPARQPGFIMNPGQGGSARLSNPSYSPRDIRPRQTAPDSQRGVTGWLAERPGFEPGEPLTGLT